MAYFYPFTLFSKVRIRFKLLIVIHLKGGQAGQSHQLHFIYITTAWLLVEGSPDGEDNEWSLAVTSFKNAGPQYVSGCAKAYGKYSVPKQLHFKESWQFASCSCFMRQCHIWPVDSTQDISINEEKGSWCDYYTARETWDKFILD